MSRRSFFRRIPLLDPIPGKQRRHRSVNGLLTIVAVVGAVCLALYYGYKRVLPLFSPSGQTVTADFNAAPALLTGDPVRVRGVQVGQVTSIGRDRGRSTAVVSMLITDSSVHLKENASAQVLWRTLLGGNMYINLDPGSASAPPLNGPIPATQTGNQVEFDQFLTPFNATGRRAVRTMLGSFQSGFSAQGAVSGTVHDAAPALSAVAGGVSALQGQQPGDLEALVRHAGSMTGALGRDEASLAGLVGSANVTLGVTAARREALGTTIAQGPAALNDTYSTMRRLRRTLDILNPLVEHLRPGARQLGSASFAARRALANATPLLHTAQPTLRQLHGALVQLGAASAPGSNLMNTLEPALVKLRTQILPWLDQTDSIGVKNYEAIGPTFSVIDSAAQQFSGFGHLLRFQGLGGGERSISLPCATFFTDPTAPSLVNCQSLSTTLNTLFGTGSTGSTASSRTAHTRRAR
jgi:virulence factor Mce-like protein